VERCDAPQNRKVHRALDSNHIIGLCHGAETQIDGLQGPGGDDDVTRRHLAADGQGTSGDLPAESLDAWRKIVMCAVQRAPARIPRAIRFSLRFGNSSGLANPTPNGTNAGSLADRMTSSSTALVPMAVGWLWSISAFGSGISFA